MTPDHRPRVEIVRSPDGLHVHAHLVWCPACGFPHAIGGGALWDGEVVRPTFAPAFSFMSLAFTPARCGQGSAVMRCAFELQQGEYHYLSQCTHHLRHATVDCPAWPLVFGAPAGQLV
jgi:hypothetical protein